MVQLFYCTVCQSKILENHLQKHHAKMHVEIENDIYTLLTTNDAPPPVANNTDAKPSVSSFDHMLPAADENLVHVTCTICNNRMPAKSLDQHMKRKHTDVGDHVDAVGTQVSSISIDTLEKVMKFAKTATNNVVHRPQEQFQGRPASGMMTNGPKTNNPFATPFSATPKINASTPTVENSLPFYTLRVSVDQMKQLMAENRIEPKHGFLYLK